MNRLRDSVRDLANYLGDFFLDSAAFLAGAAAFLAFLVLVVWLGGWLRDRIGRRLADRLQTTGSATVLVDNAARVILFALALILALGVVGVRTDALVTWIGVIVAALSIALQDVIKNLVAGFYLLVERPFGIGDQIAVADQRGKVERIDLRVTEIRNGRDESVLIPNYVLFSQVVVAYPDGKHLADRIQVTGIPGDPESVESRLSEVARSALGQNAEFSVELAAVATDGSTAALTVRTPGDTGRRNQLILAIAKSFPGARIDMTSTGGAI